MNSSYNNLYFFLFPFSIFYLYTNYILISDILNIYKRINAFFSHDYPNLSKIFYSNQFLSIKHKSQISKKHAQKIHLPFHPSFCNFSSAHEIRNKNRKHSLFLATSSGIRNRIYRTVSRGGSSSPRLPSIAATRRKDLGATCGRSP